MMLMRVAQCKMLSKSLFCVYQKTGEITLNSKRHVILHSEKWNPADSLLWKKNDFVFRITFRFSLFCFGNFLEGRVIHKLKISTVFFDGFYYEMFGAPLIMCESLRRSNCSALIQAFLLHANRTQKLVSFFRLFLCR